jgi:hypothetical protein
MYMTLPHPLRRVLPLAVEEGLHACHPLALAGLHLRRRPVDRGDLGLGTDGPEEVVAGPPVALEEPVALDVVVALADPELIVG